VSVGGRGGILASRTSVQAPFAQFDSNINHEASGNVFPWKNGSMNRWCPNPLVKDRPSAPVKSFREKPTWITEFR
jgi:hypothetical protein